METVKLQSSKILSSGEEKAISQKISDLKDIRDEKEITQGVAFEATDPAAIDAQIKELEKLKAAHGVPQLSPSERVLAEKELKILTEDLQTDMPRWNEYVSLTPKDGARYTSLVQKIVNWERDPLRRQKVQRWKTLRRMLFSDNPMAASTTYLFPQ